MLTLRLLIQSIRVANNCEFSSLPNLCNVGFQIYICSLPAKLLPQFASAIKIRFDSFGAPKKTLEYYTLVLHIGYTLWLCVFCCARLIVSFCAVGVALNVTASSSIEPPRPEFPFDGDLAGGDCCHKVNNREVFLHPWRVRTTRSVCVHPTLNSKHYHAAQKDQMWRVLSDHERIRI